MKVGVRADDLRLVLQYDTALDLCRLELIERAERLVSDSLIGQGPQALTGLQFGRRRGEEEQMDAFGHHQFFAGMPARMTLVPAGCAWPGPRRRSAANCAKAIVNTSARTVGQSNHSVCPVAGCTKL